MLYNEERKRQFIKENNNFVDSKLFEQRTLSLFNGVGDNETRLRKDACDFSYTEILDYYRLLLTPSFDRLVVVNNTLKTYTAWCHKNGYIQDGLNHYEEITSEILNTCVNYGQQRESYVSREDLIEVVNSFKNPAQQVMILGLYEGLTLDDLNEMTLDDVDLKKHTVKCEGRTLSISNELAHYIEDSAETYEWFDENGEQNKRLDLDPSDKRIIKTYEKLKSGDRTMQFFNMLKRIKNTYGYTWLSAAKLPQIGAINMLLDLWKAEEGKSVEQVASDHLKEIRLYYGQYWKYGKRMELKFGFVFE